MCFLEGFHETPSFFVAQIVDAVPQDCNRYSPFQVDCDFISAETGNNAFNDFTLKKGKEQHRFFFHQGKKGLVLDMISVPGGRYRFQGKVPHLFVCLYERCYRPGQVFGVEELDMGLGQDLITCPINV